MSRIPVTHLDVDVAARRRWGPKTSLRVRTGPHGFQWWIVDGSGSLRAAAPTLDLLYDRITGGNPDHPAPQPAAPAVSPAGEGRNPMNQTMLDTNQVARILKIRPNSVSNLVRHRGLKASTEPGRGGNHYRIAMADLESWMQTHKVRTYRRTLTALGEAKAKARPAQRPERVPTAGKQPAYFARVNGPVAKRLRQLQAIGIEVDAFVEIAVYDRLKSAGLLK